MALFDSLIFLLCVVLMANNGFASQITDLNGRWHFEEESGFIQKQEATVPGGIYTDLKNNKILNDIFFGYYDVKTKWVQMFNWTYYRDFTVKNDLLKNDNINIVFDGLDTFATIFINEKQIGRSENMFVQYIFDVKNVLKPGQNALRVKFRSPVDVANKTAAEQSKLYEIPPDCPPEEYNGQCHVNMIRKMQASFSWDWGPAFGSMGIWKNVYIESYNESRLRHVTWDVSERDGDNWLLNIEVHFANNTKKNAKGKLMFNLKLNFTNISKIFDVDESLNGFNEIIFSASIEIPKGYVNVWWPNGYGSQDLYKLKTIFTNENGSEFYSKIVKIGFRTVELVQDKIGSGLSFYFKINGIPIFMKGSNEIPIDILPENGRNKTTIKKLLTAVRDSHMNMLRVWGGGVYESDYFYDLADEMGILIWQDFMFACALYPTNDAFLSNVLDEVRYQTKRLGSHVSVTLFAGNNENEAALVQNWYTINPKDFSKYKKDYVKLYIDTIKKEFERLTHKRAIFLSSSPTNGKESQREGFVARNPASSLFGDVHYYNYVFDPFDTNIYPVPRFASEYGYQSFPSISSIMSATNNVSDLDINGIFLEHRQHHPMGNGEMMILIDYQMNLPDKNSSKYNEMFIYYSQILQAMSVKIETEHYRRYRGRLNGKGEGNTMGALYWQLNDVWIAPTWSGIDYLGKWKMLQYYTKHFFAPVIITGVINAERTLEIYVVSDLLSIIKNVTASIYVYNWESFEPLTVTNLIIDVLPSQSQLISSFDIDSFLSGKNCGSLDKAKNNCFFYLTLNKENKGVAPNNFVLPSKLKHSKVKVPGLKINSIREIKNATYEIEITSNAIAPFVWVESNNIRGQFSDNGFLQVNRSVKIYFYSESKRKTSVEELKNTFLIYSYKTET